MSEQEPEIVIPIHTSSLPFPLASTGVTPSPPVVRSGIFVYGSAILPPSPTNEANFTGLLDPPLNTDIPEIVLLQTRQSENVDRGFRDQFALQVVTTSRDAILVNIKRLDQGGGWGQHLRIDLLLIDVILGPPPQ